MEYLNNPIVILIIFALSFAAGAVWKMNKASDNTAEKKDFRANSAVVAVVFASVFAFFQLPSLSIDINSIFGYAFNVVNAFMPLIAIIGGLGLGFSLIGKISSLFSRSI